MVTKQLALFRYYDRITKMNKILRRYFVINAFDGALTVFGVLLGSFLADVADVTLVVTIGLAACIAVGVSGFWGAFLAEAAERKRELREIEKATLRKLDKTDIKRAYEFASIVIAMVDGLSPFLSAIIILTPFMLHPQDLTIETLYYSSFALSVVVFFLLGVFLGRISRENIVVSGIKFVLAGAVCMLVVLLLT